MNKAFFISENSPKYIKANYWSNAPMGGDTIFVDASRTKALKFVGFEGDETNPIVVINHGGQVAINDAAAWGALTFENCKFIKVTGEGHSAYKYGFTLSAKTCGLAFSGLSSDCEAAFVKISHDGFFGIMAKKDYKGNPPTPAPVFANLVIHDCFIENVSEGMYLGETISPGMEFKHVRVFNNIVRNTRRECIQIANMVEDIEIFNNTLLNGGTDNMKNQGSIFQVGDNSVAKVYRNIMIGASTYGIISMGMGSNYFTENYISDCAGVFVDNRKFTMNDSLIVLSGNFFSGISNSHNTVIRNMNELNALQVTNNVYDNNAANFYLNSAGSNNFELSNNNVAIVLPIIFADVDANDYSLTSDNPEAYMNLGAPGGPEYFDLEEEESVESVVSQIVLNSSMLVDEVQGGSLVSADFLVDEQSLNPEENEHAVSKSWKPFWNMTKGPYHVYIDLQQMYKVTNIKLHDMHNIKNLEVSYGEPGNWTQLFVESCNKYKTWKNHTCSVETRYIRISMNESVFAAVNEILVYGYSLETENSMMLKSATAENDFEAIFELDASADLEDLRIINNPVVDELRINVPENLSENFKVEVFNINGSLVYTEEFGSSPFSLLALDMSQAATKSGIYLMRYSNQEGISKTLKFVKNNF